MLNTLYTIVIYPITGVIEFIFALSLKIFKNPGVSVLAISAGISVLCLPLYAVAESRQAHERSLQKRFKPKLDRIKAVFSGDERYLITAAFYRQNRYHPVYALRSSFGLLIQIPFFMAAYAYLSGSEALRGASFAFIADLGAPDGLLRIAGLRVNALPLIMTAVNAAASAVYARGLPRREKFQLYGMAALFLVLLYASPAALVLYWTANNVFSLVKNVYYQITWRHKKRAAAAAFAALCLALAVYVLAVYRGDIGLRRLLAAGFAAAAAAAALAPLLLRRLRARPALPRPAAGRSVFAAFALSFAALWAAAGLFAPSTLIASSPLEFAFIDGHASPLPFILNTALQAFGLFVFWPVCLYALFPPAARRYFAAAGLALLAAALVNLFAFPGGYGLISVQLVYDNGVSHSLSAIAVNLLALALPASAAAIAALRGRLKLPAAAALLCLCAFAGVSAANALSIERAVRAAGAFRTAGAEPAASVEPIFPLSQNGRNTVVIMLDRAASVFIPYIFAEDASLGDAYSGFVYYPNTVSFNGYTMMGAPPVFGGYEYTPREINARAGVPLVEKHNEALLLLPRLFAEAGYAVTVTDPPYPNYSARDDLRIYDAYPAVNALVTDGVYTRTWIREHGVAFPTASGILRRSLLWYGLFKTAPLAFRQGLYLQGDWCSPVSAQKTALTLNGYAVLDYLPSLTAVSPGSADTALIMVNNTTHETSFLQAPDYRPALAVTDYGSGPFSREMAYHINAAAVKRLADWFAFLKAAGVYDNTRIILVSDHGPEPNFVVKTALPFNVDQFNPLLMVKDFAASGPLRTDRAFMSNADVPALALAGQLDGAVNPFTGNPIDTRLKNAPLYIAVSGGIHLEDPAQDRFALDPKKDWYVHTSIFDEGNWERAER
jgi:YidC/Oxa1 family membrane protein insertase